MRELAGVDEAGLGPILGPLVVAGVGLQLPPDVTPWRALRAIVSKSRNEPRKLRVDDSKKVNQGEHGFVRLEECVLSFWTAWRGALPPTLGALLSDLGADHWLPTECPWYRELDVALPLQADAGAVELLAHRLARAMRGAELQLSAIAARIVDAKEFNELVDESDNKSRTHLQVYSEVIDAILHQVGDGAEITADRCGGLMRYQAALEELWPEAQIRVVTETSRRSAYDVSARGRTARLSFDVGADARSFPTALASCVAKYLRETLIDRLNRWFCDRVPGLLPTAGYYTDGQRFVREVAALMRREALPSDLLVRSR
ncbi:MAG: hypothetical protein AAF628_06640 [Planctomycetota bacterium]